MRDGEGSRARRSEPSKAPQPVAPDPFAFDTLVFGDVLPSILKTFFFGFAIGIIGCYKGYNAGRGTESVGIAANSAVVLGSLLVLIVDVIAVQITDMLVL